VQKPLNPTLKNLLENPCKKATTQLQTKNESSLTLYFIGQQTGWNHCCCGETMLAKMWEVSDEDNEGFRKPDG
jgi:hypothetical protein